MLDWLSVISVLSLLTGGTCALWVIIHEMRHPPHMPIMAIVWPLTCLYSGPFGLWLYHRYGHAPPQNTSFPVLVAKASTHCGSGCTLGDIVAETFSFNYPALLTWLGWQSLFDEKTFAIWIFDYILAFIFGILFQYYTIKPMRKLSPWQGIIQALKADTLSLTAWQFGMYGFMAFAQFYFFQNILHSSLQENSFVFWFMMQVAMLCGFITSYPVNWIMLRHGVKEEM